MSNAEFQRRGVGDPRLALHATSALPAWLWSADGTRVLWANPVGARLFGAANGASLTKKIFSPADPHRRQVAQLAGRLPLSGAVRLERLRGFGAPPGMLATCSCARLDFADGSHGILVSATQANGRAMPLIERLQRLVEGIDSPIAAFAHDGLFVAASETARPLLGFRNLAEAGLDQARIDALRQGRVEIPIGIGLMVLQRVGAGADVGLVALIVPAAAAPEEAQSSAAARMDRAEAEAEHVVPIAERPLSGYERPALSGEAPAEFALFDEFLETTPAPANQAPDQAQPPEMEAQDLVQTDAALLETANADASAEAQAAAIDAPADEPSPDVEAVADEPARAAAAEPPVAAELAPAADPPRLTEAPTGPSASHASELAALSVNGLSKFDVPSPDPRRHPLRFMWQMDAEGRFSLGSDEFARLMGARTAAGFGRPWSEIAATFGLDPDGRVPAAIATRNTWSGITLHWPVDGGGRLPVELSGLPIYDRARNFAGYRGFGVCRDLDTLTRLAALRRFELFGSSPTPQTLSAGVVQLDHAGPEHHAASAEAPATPDPESSAAPEALDPLAAESAPQTNMETFVETPKNVLPFRPLGEPKSPVLSPVENSAFNELARQLSARLETDNGTAASHPVSPEQTPAAVEPPAPEPAAPGPAAWLVQPEPAPRGEALRDKMLLDLLPLGVLIYRLDRLLYANPAFLQRIGYGSLHALEEAGGLDALYVEPGVSAASSTSDTGTPVTISANQGASEGPPPSPSEARLYTISWDGDSALALIFSGAHTENSPAAAPPSAVATIPVAAAATGQADAEELGAILDTTAEGIVMFDAEGHINSCNRSAEALFGYDGSELTRQNLADLFAPESQRVAMDYLASIKGADIASLLEPGRELLGRVRQGGLIPLSMTMGRTRPDSPNFFAVFRDLSQNKKTESELQQVRRLADRAANAKADLLARISHEVRTPLNAIIGFAEVMIGERFGALNERYVEYMKDIRASGERVITIISDLLDLSRIETGKLDLNFASQNLNDLVEQCVAVMQPQANRERIIIRTSLAHMLPPVIADARALHQIALNLIGNSIHLANAGGQVIVSTALSDFGEVVLRVRDTGHGLNDREVAAALEPFRTQPPSDQASDAGAVNLSLTKALVEANRARFHIKTAPHSGTLIEVVFSHALAGA